MHMMADAAVSAGVVVAALVILLTGWSWLDPAVSLAVMAVIVWGTWGLLRDSLALSLAAVPPTIDPGIVRAYLAGLPDVRWLHTAVNNKAAENGEVSRGIQLRLFVRSGACSMFESSGD